MKKKVSNASRLTDDPAAFAAWARTASPTAITEKGAINYLTSKGVYITPKDVVRKKAKRGPLEVGEIVRVEGTKCTHPQNTANCKKLSFSLENPIYCVVLNIFKPEDLKENCTIEIAPISREGRVGNKFQFTAVYPTKIAGLQKKLERAEKKGDLNLQKDILSNLRDKSLSPHDGVGLYRSYKDKSSYMEAMTPKSVTTFAIVYDRGGNTPAPKARKDLTRDMLAQRKKKTSLYGNFSDLMDGDLADYSVLYYEGEIVSAGYNKKGDFYFRINERGGRGFTSINPSVGKLYYISSERDMPSERAWMEEFKERLSDIVNYEVSDN